MKRSLRFSASAVLFFFLLCTHAQAADLLIPVGKIVGLQLRDDRVTVAAFDEAHSGCAKACGLKIGDTILDINSIPVHNVEDVRKALAASDSSAALTVRRGSRQMRITLVPEKTQDGPKLGIYLRQGIAGVGTVTFYDPLTNRFGALGHGVNDAGGCLLQMTEGIAFPARILSVTKGKCGHPGQLKGTADSDASCGTILRNTPQGVFGIAEQRLCGEPVAVASEDQLHTGKASILSTIRGASPQEYTVEIVKLYPADRKDGRNLLIRVTDPKLLEETGGIVQGMSGSPILQDGRIVGAVTHVLVNDPTMGYGIFIGNMLDAAG